MVTSRVARRATTPATPAVVRRSTTALRTVADVEADVEATYTGRFVADVTNIGVATPERAATRNAWLAQLAERRGVDLSMVPGFKGTDTTPDVIASLSAQPATAAIGGQTISPVALAVQAGVAATVFDADFALPVSLAIQAGASGVTFDADFVFPVSLAVQSEPAATVPAPDVIRTASATPQAEPTTPTISGVLNP